MDSIPSLLSHERLKRHDEYSTMLSDELIFSCRGLFTIESSSELNTSEKSSMCNFVIVPELDTSVFCSFDLSDSVDKVVSDSFFGKGSLDVFVTTSPSPIRILWSFPACWLSVYSEPK